MEPNVAKLANVHRLTLRDKIDQQRQTVDALKREGHECRDAQRQLDQMLAELKASDKTKLA